MYMVNADVAEAMDELDEIAPGTTQYWPEEQHATAPVAHDRWCNYTPLYKALIPGMTIITIGILVFGIAAWICFPG